MCLRLTDALLVVLPQGLPCVGKELLFFWKDAARRSGRVASCLQTGFRKAAGNPGAFNLEDKVLPGPGGGCAPGGGISLTMLFDVCKVLVFGILRFGGAAVFSRASKL